MRKTWKWGFYVKGNWPMRENLNAIKRLVAFTLTVLLLGTTIWNDVFVIATEENHCSEYEDEQTYAASILQPVGEGDGYCDHCGQVEQAHVHAEEPVEEPAPAEETQVDAAAETVEGQQSEEGALQQENQEEGQSEVPTEDVVDATAEQPEDTTAGEAAAENGENTEISEDNSQIEDNPEETPVENIEETADEIEETEAETEEEIPEEDLIEEDTECEHEWVYTSNGDGTHVKKCAKCEEESTEECTLDEEGKCALCGYQAEVECEHEWTYTSNENGTHIKKCSICGEEVEEACDLDENGVCRLCGYEDERLIYQSYSKMVNGVTVTVSGEMPRGAKITVFAKPLEKANRIVNENLEEGRFTALNVFDIDIYRRSGEKYQPEDEGKTVDVSFAGISELKEVEEEEVVVYRLEDNETVTEIENTVEGTAVSFDAEHFTSYIVGTITTSDLFITLMSTQPFATVMTASGATYTRVMKAKFDVSVSTLNTLEFTAKVYKNVSLTNPEAEGKVLIAEGTERFTPDKTGAGTVEIELNNGTNSYIRNGETYSIVVSCSNNSVDIGYGKAKNPSYSVPTFINFSGTKWEEATTYNEIFYIVPNDTIKLTSTTEDAYEITDITAANTAKDGSGYLHYSKGDKDTLTAVILDSANKQIDRQVTWTSSNTAVVSIDSKGVITALKEGEAVITATYMASGNVEKTRTQNVYVLKFTLDDWDPNGDTTKTWTYTGAAIKPTVKAYSSENGTVSVTVADTDYSNNVKASTDTEKASVNIHYTVNSKTYTFNRKYTISPATITADYFEGATYDPTTKKINGIKKVGGLQPVQGTDFTITAGSPTTTATGVQYAIKITGMGNYTGVYDWTYTMTGVDVNTVLTARLTTQGKNLTNYSYTGEPLTLTVQDGAWLEVAFYSKDTLQQVKNIITPNTATPIIAERGATTASADPYRAGKKTLIFTMNNSNDTGYVGSISVDFEIYQEDINTATIEWKHNNVTGNNNFAHTGSPIEVVPGTDFDIKYGNTTLVAYDSTKSDAENAKADYKMSYSGDRTKVSDTPSIRITALAGGNFKSYRDFAFKIVPSYENDLTVIITDALGKHSATNGQDTGFSMDYNPFQKSKWFDSSDTTSYEPSANNPNISVELEGDNSLSENDYLIEVFDDAGCTEPLTKDVKSGIKYIRVSAKSDGRYAGKDPIVVTYKVNKVSINDLQIDYNRVDRTFTGQAQTVADGDLTINHRTTEGTYPLTKGDNGEDYKIANYKNNTNAGTATFDIVTNDKNYTGSITGSSNNDYKFTIDKASLAASNTNVLVGLGTGESGTYPYNSKVYTPKVKVSIVTNGVTTFEEELNPAQNSSLSTTNFSVEYDNDPAPGRKNVKFTATANGNFKDWRIADLFEVGNNTSGYTITVTGSNGVNVARPLPSGAEENVDGTITRYYYLDSNFRTEYTGAKQSCAVSVKDSEGTTLYRYRDYTCDFSSTSINAYTLADSAHPEAYKTDANAPYIIINGIGSYYKNNAIVYFDIQPKELTEDNVTATSSALDYDSTKTYQDEYWPAYVVKNGNTTLNKGSDYTIAAYNSEDQTQQWTNVAGEKYAVITGKENYKGTVVKKYTIGRSLADAEVIVTNPFATGSYTDTNYSKLVKVDEYQVRWLNGYAPKITLKWGDVASVSYNPGKGSNTATTVDGVQFADSSSLNLTDNKYASRATGATDTNYNTITLNITVDSTNPGAFYGSRPIVYKILPVDISDTSKVDSSKHDPDYKYTGDVITPNKVYLKYIYGENKEYWLNNAEPPSVGGAASTITYTDFKLDPETIGPVYNSGIVRTAIGQGNFKGERGLTFRIVAGDVVLMLQPKTKDGVTKDPIDMTASLKKDETSGAGADDLVTEIEDTQETYFYQRGQTYEPNLYLLDTSKKNVLVKGIDYTIEYHNNTVASDDTTKATAVLTLKTASFVARKITVTFNIQTNDIGTYSRSLVNLPYTPTPQDSTDTSKVYTPKAIREMVKDDNSLLTVAFGDKILKFGYDESDRTADYVILTDEDDSAWTAYKTKNNLGVVPICGDNTNPYYTTAAQMDTNINYIWVKGINAYSGFRKVPFNIILNLNDNSIVRVYTDKARYDLDDDGKATVKAKIMYTGINNVTFGTELEGDNYTISRGRDKLPGPDRNITVTGQNACKGTVTNVCYKNNDGTTEIPAFLASLGTYKGISISGGTVYAYTGNEITISFKGINDGIDNTDDMAKRVGASANPQDGDYQVIFKKNLALATNEAPKAAGKWYAIIKAQANSRFFKADSDTSTNPLLESNFVFYIKYFLRDCVFEFEGATETSDGYEVGYEGTEVKVPIKIYPVDKSAPTLYDYNEADTDARDKYIKINKVTVPGMGTYDIVASSNNTEFVYDDSVPKRFTVKGAALTSLEFKNSSDEHVIFKGSKYEPEMVVMGVGSSTPLKQDLDYTIKYTDNYDAGTGKVLVEGKGNYTGTLTEEFTIAKKNLGDSDIKIDVEEVHYIGEKYDKPEGDNTDNTNYLTPEITVTYGDYELKEGRDYDKPTYSSNHSIATKVLNSSEAKPKVSITAASISKNFTGTASADFEIKTLDISVLTEVQISPTEAEYTGVRIDVETLVKLKVPYGDKVSTLQPYNASTGKGDYEIKVFNSAGVEEDPVEMGNYTLEITGRNSCQDSVVTVPFTIKKRSLPDNFHYYYQTNAGFIGTFDTVKDLYPNETDRDPVPGIIARGKTPTKGEDEQLVIWIEDVTAVTKDVDNPPTIHIFDYGLPLVNGKAQELSATDYSISVTNAKGAGTAAWERKNPSDDPYHALVASTSPAVTITAKGDRYTGSITLPYNIGKNINNLGLKIEYSIVGQPVPCEYKEKYDNPTKELVETDGVPWHYTYNGDAQTPGITVYNGSTLLYKDRDYTITYTDFYGNEDASINAGYKKVVITGTGDYCGTMSQVYAIYKKAVSASGGPFTKDNKENPMTTDGKELTFSLSGTGIYKFTEATVRKYLVPQGLKEKDISKFVDYYYAIYDGSPIRPEVTVKDNTLGKNGNSSRVISSTDLNITDDSYSRADEVTTFTYTESDPDLTCNPSNVTVRFADESAAGNTNFDKVTNYYVGSASVKYDINYIIVQDNITEDYTVDFINGLADKEQIYNEGKYITPGVVVKKGSRPLDIGQDYTVEYFDNFAPGEARAVITGVNNYRGEKTLTFKITANLNLTSVYYKDQNGNLVCTEPYGPQQQYTGTYITKGDPEILLVLKANNNHDDITLKYGVDYTGEGDQAHGSSDSYVRNGWVEYSGLNKYWTGTKKVEYPIKYSESDIKVTNNKGEYKFTGKEIKPDFGINISTATIKKDQIKYESVELASDGSVASVKSKLDLIGLGYVRATIPFAVGDYTGEVETIYQIVPRAISECTVKYALEQRYTGRAVKPAFTIVIESEDGSEPYELLSTDYKVDYGNYICNNYADSITINYNGNNETVQRAGKGLFVLTGISNEITGTKAYEYAIKLQKVANLIVTENTGSTMTTSWVRDVYSEGTDIQLQKMDSAGVYKTYMTTRAVGKANTYKFEKLSSSTNYRIVATAYATLKNGTTVYSEDATKEVITGIAAADVSVVSTAAGKAKVSWTSTGDVVLYYIYRADDPTSEGKVVAIIPASTGAYTNSKLTSGATYYYHIDGYALIDGVLSDKPVNSSEHVAVTIQ